MSFEHLLFVIDDDQVSPTAIHHVTQLALAFNSRLTLMSVVSIDPFFAVEFYKIAPSFTQYLLKTEAKILAQLTILKHQMLQQGILNIHTKVIHDLPIATGVLTVADEINADLIIVAAKNRNSLKKILAGSTPNAVLAISPLPVMVIN
ncbi:universal stress protein [Acinetobacter rudis]|uniref:UspA domain-containing protein n=1 Tax=Acinetobacter rudis CIP 110305 TaxID=421052 RepID=S3NH00_9GAMM|nr:universal stress protein [Acinetobacter rudis]EPF73624.1 hypothetical protein F945_02061 [Acinetobacter rudis CIP 110305]